MARTLLLRPFVFSAFRTPLLRSSVPSYSHAIRFVSPISLENIHASESSGNQVEIRGGVSFNGSKFQSLKRRRFCIRAAQVNDSGSINSPLMQSMEKKIKDQLNAEVVTVKDAYGDGRHVSIDVISLAFEGQSAVNRQRMVYKAIWEELQSTVHAVDQMTTRTPGEAVENR